MLFIYCIILINSLFINTKLFSERKRNLILAALLDPRPPLVCFSQSSSPVSSFVFDILLQDRDAILDGLHIQLTQTQWLKKSSTGKHHRDVEFEVGDSVFYAHSFVVSLFIYGSWKVAYKLQLPPTSEIHSIFYVSQLKADKGCQLWLKWLPTKMCPKFELLPSWELTCHCWSNARLICVRLVGRTIT